MGADVGGDGADEEQNQADRGGSAERRHRDADQESDGAGRLEESQGVGRRRFEPHMVMFLMTHSERRKSRVAAVPLAAAVTMPKAT